MKVTVFAKTAHTKDGKEFIRFLGKMTNKKTGEEITVTIKTGKTAPRIDENKCPLIIEYNKPDANLSTRKYVNAEGVERESYTLWLKNWKESSEKYVDHSLDDFE